MHLTGAVLGTAAASDLVRSIPDFPDTWQTKFSVYSGYLDVDLSGSSLEYSSLRIHYEFHTCTQEDCPVAVWHQGGPGGSGIYGAWTETGPFQYMGSGAVENYEYAWNNAANMLYLESPAGSTISEDSSLTGFSTCSKGSRVQRTCKWNDVTQAEAYAYTLKAFYLKFPEFMTQDLYLVGESYAGQYIPNIATFMVANPNVVQKNLSGIAVGNGCFGGGKDFVVCNGRYAERNDFKIYYGKGLISKKLYTQVLETCEQLQNVTKDGIVRGSAQCLALIERTQRALGPYNIYNVYDNCPQAALLSDKKELRDSLGLIRPKKIQMYTVVDAEEEASTFPTAGYPWNCESDPKLDEYFTRPDVLEALHLDGPGSGFRYSRSGPASVLLYPELLKKMRVLIYNGDADLCVPYLGNEQWVSSMKTDGVATEKEPWHPWYDKVSDGHYAPAGYVTTYTIPNKTYTATGDDFAFLTIRLAGHMVAQYQPHPALTFFQRFLAGDAY